MYWGICDDRVHIPFSRRPAPIHCPPEIEQHTTGWATSIHQRLAAALPWEDVERFLDRAVTGAADQWEQSDLFEFILRDGITVCVRLVVGAARTGVLHD